MSATATTVQARGSVSRTLALGAGFLLAMLLGAALALAATGWFEAGDRAVPTFDATGALHGHVLREYGVGTVVTAPTVDAALHEHMLRENGAR